MAAVAYEIQDAVTMNAWLKRFQLHAILFDPGSFPVFLPVHERSGAGLPVQHFLPALLFNIPILIVKQLQ